MREWAPTERKHMIPLHALIPYLDPSLRTYVYPSLMRRMRYSFSVNSRIERKRDNDNARIVAKLTKMGHFGKLRIWGWSKNAHIGITMCKQILCAYSLQHILSLDHILPELTSIDKYDQRSTLVHFVSDSYDLYML